MNLRSKITRWSDMIIDPEKQVGTGSQRGPPLKVWGETAPSWVPSKGGSWSMVEDLYVVIQEVLNEQC